MNNNYRLLIIAFHNINVYLLKFKYTEHKKYKLIFREIIRFYLKYKTH
jgi:hypothetical protein